MGKPKKYYAVMRLNTTIIAILSDGRKQTLPLDECAGYLPVFKTKKEAVKASEKGMYQVLPITTLL
jgi:phosphosulfolactate phosphohydrolase-like enzyme